MSFLVRRDRAIIGSEHYAILHRCQLASKNPLVELLILGEGLLDVVVKVESNDAAGLLYLEPDEALHERTTGDIEVPCIGLEKLVHEPLARWDALDVVDEESVNDEILLDSLDEDGLLAVHRQVTVLLHPPREALVPSSRRLLVP